MGIRKGGLAAGEVKSVRWTLFSPWENPLIAGRTRYGCEQQSIRVAEAFVRASRPHIDLIESLILRHDFPGKKLFAKNTESCEKST